MSQSEPENEASVPQALRLILKWSSYVSELVLPRPSHVAATSRVEHLARIVVGSCMGGVILGAIEVLERLLFHAHLYGSVRDALMHAAAAVVAHGAGAVLVCTVVWYAIRFLKARFSAAFAGVVLGSLLGALGYWYLLSTTRIGLRVPLGTGSLVAAILGGIASALLLAPFDHLLHRRPRIGAGMAALCLAPLIWLDLHGHHRIYGNANLSLQSIELGIAGFLSARLALTRSIRWVKSTGATIGALLGSALTVLLLFGVTANARVAILRYGSFERTVARQIFFPIRNTYRSAEVTAMIEISDAEREASPSKETQGDVDTSRDSRFTEQDNNHEVRSPQDAGPRSIVWIVIDTVRADAALPFVSQFDGFTSFSGYRSCGSNTRAFLTQLFGRRGCRPRSVPGPLLSELRRQRLLQTAIFSSVQVVLPDQDTTDVYGAFDKHEIAADDRSVLSLAGSWTEQQEVLQHQYFALLHLQGGHLPYAGQGRTTWLRYVDTIRLKLQEVSRFVGGLPKSTVVIVMSDHGEEFGEHDGGFHARTLFDEVLAVPLLIRGSSFPPGKESCYFDCSRLLELVFHLATARQASRHATCARPMSGHFAMLDYNLPYPLEPKHIRSIVLEDDLKVIWDFELGTWELFDLKTDPRELHNLADVRPADFLRARRQLYAAMRSCSP